MIPDLKKSSENLIFAGILVVAFTARLFRLGERQLWYDELGTALDLVHGSSNWVHFSQTPFDPPLFFWLAKLGSLIFGMNEFALRLPAALFGILAVAAAWHLGRRLYGFHVALLFSTLMAINPFTLQMSQEARMYSATFAFSLLLALLLDHYGERQQLRVVFLLGVLSVAAFFTHLIHLLYIGLIPLFMILHRLNRRSIRDIASFTLIAGTGLFLIWPVFTAAMGFNKGEMISGSIYSLPWRMAQSLVEYCGYTRAVDSFPWARVLFVPTLLIFAGAIVQGFRSTLSKRTWLSLFFFLTLFLGISMYLGTKNPFQVNARRLSPALPGLLLLASAGLSLLPVRIRTGSFVVIAVTYLTSIGIYYQWKGNPDSAGWREAIATMTQEEQPGDHLVMLPRHHHHPLREYEFYYRYEGKGTMTLEDNVSHSGRTWIITGVPGKLNPKDRQWFEAVSSESSSCRQYEQTQLWLYEPMRPIAPVTTP